MAVDQFRVERIADVCDVKGAFLLADFGIEKHMEKHIAELLANIGVVFVYKSVAKFIDFLYGVRSQ